MKNLHLVDVIVLILLLAGGLNWGLVGLFKVNLVTSLFGEALSRIVFILVGLAAGYKTVMWIRSSAK